MKRHVNLIPVRAQREQQVHDALSLWTKLTLGVALICTAIAGVEWARLSNSKNQIEALQRQFQPLAELLEEQRLIAEQIKQLESREQFMLGLGSGVHGVSLLGAISDSAAETDNKVYITRMNYDSRSENERVVTLSGAGYDGLSVATFLENLRASGFFLDVSIGETGKLAGGAPSMQAFEIVCAF